LQTLLTSDFDTEKAEADFCHVKWPLENLFLLTKVSQLNKVLNNRKK